VLGTVALRLDQADLLPFDYSAYGAEMEQEARNLATAAARQPEETASVKIVTDAAARFAASASRESQALAGISSFPQDPKVTETINRNLAEVERDFLAPEGLAGRPWFKHTLFAPGSYTGYSAEVMPGVTEALTRHDLPVLRREANAVAAALERAARRLDDIAHLARQTNASPVEGR